jgi:hypothetical protein
MYEFKAKLHKEKERMIPLDVMDRTELMKNDIHDIDST